MMIENKNRKICYETLGDQNNPELEKIEWVA